MSRSTKVTMSDVGPGRFRLLVAACCLTTFGFVSAQEKDGLRAEYEANKVEIERNQKATEEFFGLSDGLELDGDGIEGEVVAALWAGSFGRDDVMEEDDWQPSTVISDASEPLFFDGPSSSASFSTSDGEQQGTPTDGPGEDAELKGYVVIMKKDALLTFARNRNGGRPEGPEEPHVPGLGVELGLGMDDADEILLNQAELKFDFDADDSKAGEKLDFTAPFVEEYATILKDEQMNLVTSIGMNVEDVTNSYVTAVNGFSIKMTETQARELEEKDDVAMVHEDYELQPTTDTTGEFLGIKGKTPDGSSCRRNPYDGEGVRMCIIDTGVWPEHPSFEDDGSLSPTWPELSWRTPSGLLANPCDFGNTDHNPEDKPFRCNNKLIGARTFLNGFQSKYNITDEQFKSCRDDNGHGTHVASTAAGNANVPVDYPGYPSDTKVSGIAPKAQIIGYKVCSSAVVGTKVRGGCFLSDSAAAIDQAIWDGCDVINFSIGGPPQPMRVTEMMWLEATRAGIFVATSAGNSGRKGKNTVGSPAGVPWMFSVGASTEPTEFQAMVSYGDASAVGASAFDHEKPMEKRRNLKKGDKSPKSQKVPKGQQRKQQKFVEAEESDPLPQAGGGLRERDGRVSIGNQVVQPQDGDSGGSTSDPSSDSTVSTPSCRASSADAGVSRGDVETYVETCLVDAADAGDALCLLGNLTETIVKGCIVLCRRGLTARVEKSQEVQRAGGVGMIFYNALGGPKSRHPDLHSVQTVHLTYDQGHAIKEYIARTPNPRAKLSVDMIGTSTAPIVADFSSRGQGFYKHQLNPEICAPGVNILAGHTPMPFRKQPQGMLYQVISGTSMSSPHIAGVLAMIKQAFPRWSAAKARSAIMTTAHQDVYVNEDGAMADPMDMGSGHLDTNNRWLAPGLVYSNRYVDYLAFLCRRHPSLFRGNCASFFQKVGVPLEPWNLNHPSMVATDFAGTRTLFRTVESVHSTKAVMTYTATVAEPPGYKVDVNPSELKLRAGESRDFTVTVTRLRSPNIIPYGKYSFGSLTWIDDNENYSVRSPIAVNSVAVHGIPRFLDKKPDDAECMNYAVTLGFEGVLKVRPFLQPGKRIQGFVGHKQLSPRGFMVQGKNKLLRVRMKADGDEDLNAYLFNPDGKLVAISRGPRTNELINILNPMEGIWVVIVQGWDTKGKTVPYDLYTWNIPDVSKETYLTAKPKDIRATIGATETIELCFQNLKRGEWYWGFVLHETNLGYGNLPLTVVQADLRSA